MLNRAVPASPRRACLAGERIVVYPSCIYISCGAQLAKARVFQSGNSQAVRLPKAFRFKSKEVEIFRRGNEVVLRETPVSLADLLEHLDPWPDDYELPAELPQEQRDLTGL